MVSDFRVALPDARIYVYDNNSTDDTSEVASAHGALVKHEPLQGKGNVVRRMFADIDADVYVLVDGDGTYEAGAAPKMIEALLKDKSDMVTGIRDDISTDRLGHRTGNRVISALVAAIFGRGVGDLLSGYRVFSRRFVFSFPAQSSGFEIETELSVHALSLRMPISEVRTKYGHRDPTNPSKLNTIRDGLTILKRIVVLLKEERPFHFFAAIAAFVGIIGLILGIPVVMEFMSTGLVPRLPSAMLASALVLLAFVFTTCGLILDSVARTRKELRRMWYLNAGPRE